MAQGLQVWDAAGVMTFDSNTAVGGVIVEVLKTTTSTITRNYTNFPGRTASYFLLEGFLIAETIGSPTISYGSGYPSISFPAGVSPYLGTYMVVIS